MKPEISIAWAKKKIDCTPKGRKICQGKCCKFKSLTHGRYYPNELKKLPKELKDRLEYREYMFHCKDNNGICDFIDECFKHPEYRPDQCKIWGFKFTTTGKLIIGYWNVSNCPCYRKGDKTIFENLKDDLIDVFGEEWYKEKLDTIYFY